MSAKELISQVAGLPPNERKLFKQLLRELENQDGLSAKVKKPSAVPDFLGRAKAVWGEKPAGKSLSIFVSEARGGFVI